MKSGCSIPQAVAAVAGGDVDAAWFWDPNLTQAIEKEGKRLLLCFDKKTGKQLWGAGTIYKEPELTHGTNPYCAASPATDGERVYVYFGSVGLLAYDFAGKEVWRKTLPPPVVEFGASSSPVVAGEVVVQVCDADIESYLLAVDRKTEIGRAHV